MYWVYW